MQRAVGPITFRGCYALYAVGPVLIITGALMTVWKDGASEAYVMFSSMLMGAGLAVLVVSICKCIRDKQRELLRFQEAKNVQEAENPQGALFSLEVLNRGRDAGLDEPEISSHEVELNPSSKR